MRHTLKIAGLGIGLLSSAAAAAQEVTPSVPKLGIQYRYEMNYDDDGLNKDAKSDVPHLTHGLKAFRLLGEGKVADRLTYGFRIGMEKGLSFDYGWVRWSLGENHAVLFGKQKSRVYGWEYRLSNPLTIFKSHGMQTSPYAYDNMVAFENKYGWGTITLQLAEDKAPVFTPKIAANTGATSGWTNDNPTNEVITRQPAVFLEYVGAFGPLKPLLQAGMYDMGHSSIYTAGLLFEAADFAADLDYTVHNIGAKGVKTAGVKKENLVSTSSTFALNMSYQTGGYKPFLHFSMYDMEEFTNSGQAKTSVNSAVGTFDDNGSLAGLGLEFTQNGDAFRPYLALMMESGKFPAAAGGDKNMSHNELLAGVRGQF